MRAHYQKKPDPKKTGLSIFGSGGAIQHFAGHSESGSLASHNQPADHYHLAQIRAIPVEIIVLRNQ
jgi:hypothetical protein